MINPKVQWTLPTPLWNTGSPTDDATLRDRFHEPFILRFASDSFMDEFFQLIEHAPQRIGEWEVERETWRDPTVPPVPIDEMPRLAQRLFRLRASLSDQANGLVPTGTLLPTETAPPAQPLKLYQPGHQRFYLVTAGLVCRKPGLPEKYLGTGNSERVSFVVRRLWPKADNPNPDVWNSDTCDEYAYVARGSRFEWRPVSGHEEAFPEEDRNALFRVAYTKAGQSRHLWAGLVPVGKREAYLGSVRTPATAEPSITTVDPRPDLLEMQVMAPWSAIVNYKESRSNLTNIDNVPDFFDNGTDYSDNFDEENYESETTYQIHMQSWYALLDLADFLKKYIKEVWDVIDGTSPGLSGDGNSPPHTLLDTLNNTSDGERTLGVALKLVAMETNRMKLESAITVYEGEAGVNWPSFTFDMTAITIDATTMTKQMVDALPFDPPDKMPPRPFAAQQKDTRINEPAWFVIHCLYERPYCDPISIPVLSAASRPFQMASFFDPDAPARPIRIALPMDTTPAGLRKFDRNTAFMMSDMLCGQVSKMRSLTLGDLVRSVLPWPLHKDLDLSDMGPCPGDGDTAGLVCSLSIPIVTICALILLLMIVSLLDMFFRWMPYFIACFSIPGFKAKE